MFTPEPSQIFNVVVVEDDLFFVRAFSAAIEGAADLRLQGVAHTCRQARVLLEQPAADVLLVDLGLPDGPGLDIIRAAQVRWPKCHVMVSTVFGDEGHVIQSLEAGAAGYLLKDSSPERVSEEIRSVLAGGSPISPLIARRLLTRFRHALAAESAPAPLLQQLRPITSTAAVMVDQVRLSPRERQVLEYISKGFSYEEIAALMAVSRNTVLSFVRRIYAKLKVRSQLEAVHEARSQGLLVD